MKQIVLLVVVFYSFQCFGQLRADKFLMYSKTVMPFYYTGDTVPHNDTLFVLYNFLSVGKSTALMSVIDPKYGREQNQKWKFDRVGDFVKLRRKGNARLGYVVRDSVLKCRKCWSDSIEFLLVPLKEGNKLNPFKGQLIWNEMRWGEKDHVGKIIFGEIKDRMQDAYVISSSDDHAFAMSSYAAHLDQEFNDLVFVENFSAIQYIKPISDSTLYFDVYYVMVEKDGFVKSRINCLKKGLLADSQTNEIEAKLDGKWKSTTGSARHLVLDKNEPLTECNYSLSFKTNTLIIHRKFLNDDYRNKSDTLNFSVNATGDYLVQQGTDINLYPTIFLKHVSQDSLRLILNDVWYTINNKRRSVDLLLEMKRD